MMPPNPIYSNFPLSQRRDHLLKFAAERAWRRISDEDMEAVERSQLNLKIPFRAVYIPIRRRESTGATRTVCSTGRQRRKKQQLKSPERSFSMALLNTLRGPTDHGIFGWKRVKKAHTV